MLARVTHNAWEPALLWHNSHLWKLEYIGIGQWVISWRKGLAPGISRWQQLKAGGLNDCLEWLYGGIRAGYRIRMNLARKFKFYVSGSYETRIKFLRSSFRVLGRDSSRHLAIFAELGDKGGIDVWGRCVSPFKKGFNFTVCQDCDSLVKIETKLQEGGFIDMFENKDGLDELLGTIWMKK